MRFRPENIANLQPDERIRRFDEMPGLIQRLGSVGLQVFLVQGVFDIVHRGHVGLFQATRRILPVNGIVIAGLENDKTVQINKGPRRPVTTLDDRLAVVSEFRSIDLVFGYPDTPRYDHREDYLARWDALRPAALVAASWDPHRDQKQWQTDQAGIALRLVDYRHENSTTCMLRHIGYEE